MATSDPTALAAMTSDARIGRSTPTKRGTAGDAVRTRGPSSLPNKTNINTGTATVPITPSGSRTKILISSHVSLQSPRSMSMVTSLANRMTGQPEKHVLEVRALGAEFGHSHPMLGETVDDLRHQIVAVSADRVLGPLTEYGLHQR